MFSHVSVRFVRVAYFGCVQTWLRFSSDFWWVVFFDFFLIGWYYNYIILYLLCGGGVFWLGGVPEGFWLAPLCGVMRLACVAFGGWSSSRVDGRRVHLGYMGRGGIRRFGRVPWSTVGNGDSCQSICRSWWERSRAFPIALIGMNFGRMKCRREIVVQA